MKRTVADAVAHIEARGPRRGAHFVCLPETYPGAVADAGHLRSDHRRWSRRQRGTVVHVIFGTNRADR